MPVLTLDSPALFTGLTTSLVYVSVLYSVRILLTTLSYIVQIERIGQGFPMSPYKQGGSDQVSHRPPSDLASTFTNKTYVLSVSIPPLIRPDKL